MQFRFSWLYHVVRHAFHCAVLSTISIPVEKESLHIYIYESNLKFPFHRSCTYMSCRRKPEQLEGTHSDTGRTYRLDTERPRALASNALTTKWEWAREQKKEKLFQPLLCRQKPAAMLKGRWLTQASEHSDPEGLAEQLNPVLIHKFTPCVNPDLLCRLYVPRNKANPSRVVAFKEIKERCPTSPLAESSERWTLHTSSWSNRRTELSTQSHTAWKKKPLKLIKFVCLHIHFIWFGPKNIHQQASISQPLSLFIQILFSRALIEKMDEALKM